MKDEELEAIYNEAVDGEGMTILDGLRAVAKAEREECAKVCDDVLAELGKYDGSAANVCGDKIRKRSNVQVQPDAACGGSAGT